jgi:hypothetical protein
MSTYLSIDAQTSTPITITPSPTGRAFYSINFLCSTDELPTSSLTAEIISRLDGNLGLAENTNLFSGLLTTFPSGSGPFVRVVATSGIAPDHQHNFTTGYPGFQIYVEGEDDAATELLAQQVLNYLTNTTNTTITA